MTHSFARGLLVLTLLGLVSPAAADVGGAPARPWRFDGAIRDCAAFRDDVFPCYARGVSHRGPYKDGPGEINVPVSISGMVVSASDLHR